MKQGLKIETVADGLYARLNFPVATDELIAAVHGALHKGLPVRITLDLMVKEYTTAPSTLELEGPGQLVSINYITVT